MARIVTLLAVAIASFAVACVAPQEEGDANTVTATDALTSAEAGEGCHLVNVYRQSGSEGFPRIKAADLPKPVRPRLGLAKKVGSLAVGEAKVFLIADDTTVRFFAEDGRLIARGLTKNESIRWTGTDGTPLSCAVVTPDKDDKAAKDAKDETAGETE